MHPFLLDGFKFLFEGKEGKVEVFVANPDNQAYYLGKSDTHWAHTPSSSAYALSKILANVAPKMSRFGIIPGIGKSEGDMTLVKNFEAFIRTEMTRIEL